MQSIHASSTVTNITSAELREFMESRAETDYVLIDVRQYEEYVAGHIPGARLISLNELELYADDLRTLADHTLIFYCRSGGRSARASTWASRLLGNARIANLLGGFMAWGGPGLTGFPSLMSFRLDEPVQSLLLQALNLEKGTQLFYERLADEYKSGTLAETIATLVKAESAHSSTVHELLARLSPSSAGSFNEVYEQLSGSLLENGMPFEVALGRSRELGADGATGLLELALEIEFGAYDLYKNLAMQTEDPTAREALLRLAEQEKSHADLVLKALGSVASGLRDRKQKAS